MYVGGCCSGRGDVLGDVLGDDLGMTELGKAAKAILDSLPAGSGTNPIGKDPRYPFPHHPDQENVVDKATGYNRYVDWYNVYPVKDVSGLIEWNGPGGAQLVGGLDAPHRLAANVLIEGGDTSSFADFHAPNAIQAAKPISSDLAQPLTPAPETFTATTWHPTADNQKPPADLATNPIQPPPVIKVPTPPVVSTPAPAPPSSVPAAPLTPAPSPPIVDRTPTIDRTTSFMPVPQRPLIDIVPAPTSTTTPIVRVDASTSDNSSSLPSWVIPAAAGVGLLLLFTSTAKRR